MSLILNGLVIALYAACAAYCWRSGPILPGGSAWRLIAVAFAIGIVRRVLFIVGLPADMPWIEALTTLANSVVFVLALRGIYRAAVDQSARLARVEASMADLQRELTNARPT